VPERQAASKGPRAAVDIRYEALAPLSLERRVPLMMDWLAHSPLRISLVRCGYSSPL